VAPVQGVFIRRARARATSARALPASSSVSERTRVLTVFVTGICEDGRAVSVAFAFKTVITAGLRSRDDPSLRPLALPRVTPGVRGVQLGGVESQPALGGEVEVLEGHRGSPWSTAVDHRDRGRAFETSSGPQSAQTPAFAMTATRARSHTQLVTFGDSLTRKPPTSRPIDLGRGEFAAVSATRAQPLCSSAVLP
jgi:hypothetical protein